MKSINLKMFIAQVKLIDCVDERGFKQPLGPIFNALSRFCTENKYSDSCSLDKETYFKMTNYGQFIIHEFRVNGERYKKVSDFMVANFITQGNKVELVMVEDIDSIIN